MLTGYLPISSSTLITRQVSALTAVPPITIATETASKISSLVAPASTASSV
jgi:uncharacterized membrane protein